MATTASTQPGSSDAEATERHSPTTAPAEEVRPAGSGGWPRGLDIDVEAVDETDLDAISEALALTMLTSDTDLDRSRTDAYRRGSRWMTPATAEQYTSSSVRGSDAEWLDLESHEGFTTVTLRDPVAAGQPPGSTATEGMRAYLATVTSLGLDEWEGTVSTYQVMLVMTREAPEDPWRADIIDLVPQDLP